MYSHDFSSSNNNINKEALIEDESSSDYNPFKDRLKMAHDAKLKKYQDFFKPLNTDNSVEKKDVDDDITQLERELTNIGKKIHDYSSRRLIKIQRLGLAKFKKSFLKQHLFYL